MLPDSERKILRILANFSALYKRMPTFGEMQTKTGRTKAEIIGALATLQNELFIQWQEGKIESIMIFKTHEEEVVIKKHWHNNNYE